MAILTTNLLGKELRTPFILASGPLSYDAYGIRLAFAEGAAAVVTKTLTREAAVNPTPHMVRPLSPGIKNSLFNTEKWADLPPERWIDQELPALRERPGILIASLGHTADDVAALAPEVARAGVDLLEIVSYSAGEIVPAVETAARLVDIPILAKVTANWGQETMLQKVGECLRAGAQGITAIDSLGPTIEIDVETGQPHIAGKRGFAWLSRAAIKPVAVQAVAAISLEFGCPVVGTGGVFTPQDAVEMLMVGATAIGMCTAPLLRGLSIFAKMADGLSRWLDDHGYLSVNAVRGAALSNLREEEETDPLEFIFIEDKCTECSLCWVLCPYDALEMTGKTQTLHRERCRSCGLCVEVCHPRALLYANFPRR